MAKVKEVNLEQGLPTVEVAMSRLTNEVTTAKMSGYKALILIHGFGSSGTGGSIKAATKTKLQQTMFRGIIKDKVNGEEWDVKKRAFVSHCPQLNDFDRRISGNKGITVLLLK